MRKVALSILLLVLAASASMAIPTPVAFYQFEGDVYDTQGAYDGTAYNAPTFVAGKLGSYAIGFDGSTQYVSILRPVSTDFSISFFVRTTQTSPTGSNWYNGKGMVDAEVAGTTNDFGVSYLNSKVAFGVGSPDTTIQSTSTINSGNWVHVACTRNATTGEMKIYINGVLETTGTGPTGAKTAPANMTIGRRQSSGNFFAGNIDQLRIFDTVLTAADVADLASEDATSWTVTATAGAGGTISPSGAVSVVDGADQTFTITPDTGYNILDVTVDGVSQGAISSLTLSNVTANHTVDATFASELAAYYMFNETSGTSAYDSSGNNRTATLFGSCTWVAGHSDNAVNIPGGTSYVGLPSGVVSGLTDFTVATWVKLTTISVNSRIFDFGTSTTNYMELTPKHANSSGKLQYVIKSGTTTNTLTGNAALATGSWQHVVVTRSGNTGTLYVNGAQVGQITNMTLSPSSLGTTTQNRIGDAQATAYAHLNGAVDDFGIYGRALSSAEVSTLYSGGTTHTITASAGPGGTISPSGAVVVNDGGNQAFAITANTGYVIIDVVVDGVSQGAISSYTFTNVTADHTISATFGVTTHTIAASAGTGGTITPSGAVSVNHGANQIFNIAAGGGYQISQVTVDGVNQGAIASYTFTNVTADHTISATFIPSGGVTPVAFYAFEDNVLDTQGAFNGTAYNSPTYVTGKVGSKAIQFNGTNQYVSITRPVSTDFTIAFFVKTTQTSSTGTQWYSGKGLVDGEVGGTANDFGITYLNSKVAFGVGNADTTILSSSTINSGNWVHVACTRNSTTGEMKVYLNGGLQATGTGPTGAKTGPASLHIGNLQTNINYFAGAMDQLKIFNSVLSAADITALVGEGGNSTWWTISASAGVGGTISPSGDVMVAEGDNQTLVITPNAYYSIQDVVVDGVSRGAISSYTFSNVTANHTISVTFTGTGLAGLITGPYLQALTHNSVYVLAEMDSANTAMVEWGEDGRYGEKSYTESTEATTSLPTTYVHNIRISGLQPNRTYHYCLTTNGTRGADHTFKTAVNPGTGFRFAMCGDFKGATTVHDNISQRILAANPAFCLYAGDLSNTNDSDTFRRELFRPAELALDATVPFFNAPGNHEGWGVTAKAFQQGPDSSSGSQDYWSFDWGDAHFCRLNDQMSYGVGSAQYNWMASDLAASTKPWKIAWAHYPAYTSTSDGHGEDPTTIAVSQNLWVPNHVDMVFYCHNHFYQHNLVDGIHHMVVGSAGASLYTPTNAAYTVMSVKTYCYAIVDVTATTLDFTAYDDSGNVLETIHLTKQFTISGSVKTAGGVGIYNAVVSAGGPNSNTINPVVTDSAGNYTLSVPGPGTYEVYADALGYGASFSNVTISASGTVTNNITLTAASENGVYNGGMETIGGTAPDGWESFIQKPDSVDYLGNAWPDKADMYNISRSTASNTTPGGAASAIIATVGALPAYGVLRLDRWGVSGDACTGIAETVLTDSARSWTNNYYANGTAFVQLVHGGNDSGVVPTQTNDYRITANTATTLTVQSGSNMATAGYAAGDNYRFLKEVRNYWYTGGIRATSARRIAVDRAHVYNFYLKQKTTYSGTESNKCHVYGLVWRNSGGTEVGRNEWRWQPGTAFTQATPRLFVAPPVGATTVEACIYTTCVDTANSSWSDTSYVDDVVIDPVAVSTASAAKSLADGTHVVLAGDFVSLAPRDASGERYTDYFYVSEPDGSSGVRIENSAKKMDNLNVNEMVALSGVVRTDAGTSEKYIQANIAGSTIALGGATPATTTVATALSDANAVGKFVAVIAQVSSIAADYSYFNLTDAGSTIKVSSVGFPLVSGFAAVGNTIKVNGVVSKDGSSRVILMMNYTKQTTAWPTNDVTFFSLSDTHYGGGWATRLLHKQRIAAMNALPGTSYPASIGGTVGECRGVTVSGDITDNDNDKAGQFAEFALDFGLSGQNQLRFPVYEGCGNHDGGITYATAEGIIKRNPFRSDVTNISADGWNYSWNWGNAHFIHTNEIGSYLNQNSLDWLQNDLTTSVGTSGRPVVIVQHEGFDSFSLAFASRGEAKRLYDVIKNYNVIAIIWGHTGGYAQYKWGGIDVFGVDGMMEGFHVFHITPTELIVTRRQWSDGTWMSWTFRKTITGM